MEKSVQTSPELFPIQSRSELVWGRIRKFNRKLEPSSRNKKFSRMAKSPFAFFRATAYLYWEDLGQHGLLEAFGDGKDTRLWIHGHLDCDQFTRATDATGRLVADMGSFNQAVVADYQHDLWRLGISLTLAGRENKLSPSVTDKMVEICARNYWREIKRCRWYPHLRYAPWDEEQASGSLRHWLAQARKEESHPALLKSWIETGKRGPRFKSHPDWEPLKSSDKLKKALKRYAENLKPWPVEKPRVFEVLDLVQRRNDEGEGQPIFALVRVREKGDDGLRILNIQPSVEPVSWDFLPPKARKKTEELTQGDPVWRVILASRVLGCYTDLWMGRLTFQGSDFIVREQPADGGVLPHAQLNEDAAFQLGAILARAHCRAKDSFAKKAFQLIREDKKAFRLQVSALSHAYADQVELDYQSFLKMKKEK